MKKLLTLAALTLTLGLWAQKDPVWDNTSKTTWRKEFRSVAIPSSADGTMQKAFVYKSTSTTHQPLIVSLHTWSGDYSQKDPIDNEIIARNWNYIHPDFRGANNHPQAMCSPLVISDIEDAINFAIKHTNADPKNVHIVGTSGGGLATLAAYMNIKYPVKSFSAWAPISDIEAWYWESKGRKQKYGNDIVKSLGGTFSADNARKRSPLHQPIPENRNGAKLYIYEGIHDGYTGSVPITHSINMYNKIAADSKVSESEIIELVTKRINPALNPQEAIFGRHIHLYRKSGDVELTIFEGGHEQIPQALALIPYQPKSDTKLNILTIGDSNGQIKGGWVDQLRKMMPESKIINNSRSGMTIGFDNNSKESLNTLRNIDSYLDKVAGTKYDYIIICLGTNDTKKEFDDRQNEVTVNFKKLLAKVKTHKASRKATLIFVTPPPIKKKEIAEKYEGANDRLLKLVPRLLSIASEEGFTTLDIFNPLQGILNYYANDGVHMGAAGQQIIASQIVETIRNCDR